RSENYRPVAPGTMIAFRSDRVCRECGTRYTPPTPTWAARLFCEIGLGGPVVTSLVAIACFDVLGPEFIWRVFGGPVRLFLFVGFLSVIFAVCFRYGRWCLRIQRSSTDQKGNTA